MKIDFEKAVRTFGGTVYKIAYSNCEIREDADDIFQEAFLKLLTADKHFESEEHIKAWLIRVTINLCKQRKRSYRYRNTDPLDENIPAPIRDDGFDAEPIIEAVRSLPEKYRTVILLFYYEDMPSAQIAKTLRLTDSAVRTRLRRARALLKEKLSSYEL